MSSGEEPLEKFDTWSVHGDAGWVLYHPEDLVRDDDEARSLKDWLLRSAQQWRGSQAGRGQRNGVFDVPVNDGKWFLKQYHHGGLLAGHNDVYYDSDERFLAELRATLKARQSGVSTPEPRLLLVRRTDEGCEGFFVSQYIGDARPFTRLLRLSESQDYLSQAADALVELHDAGIDHRDYHVENLLVDPAGNVVVTDFDPVRFGTLSGLKRGLRIQRFNRSLRKYGFLDEDAEVFRGRYRDRSSAAGALLSATLDPVLSLKNTLSDFLYWSKDRTLEPVNLEKILVRAPNWLGDTVMSLPYVQKLAQHPDVGRVDVAVRSALSAVYEDHADVETVWNLPNDKSMHLPDAIREERYSSLIVIPKSFRTGYQAFSSGIPRRIGFATQGRGFFLTDRVPLRGRDRSEHHARLYMRLTEQITDPAGEIPSPRLKPKQSVLKTVRNTVSDPFFTIHPGSAYGPAKRWPPERFSAFLENLLDNRPETIVALGVDEERELAEEILGELPAHRIRNRVGETSLREAVAYLKLSRGTVANDSGIMHLSAALGTPTLGIFGSSDPELTRPLGAKTAFLYENVECSPCFEKVCPLDEDRYKCLERITETAVLDEFLRLVDSPGTEE